MQIKIIETGDVLTEFEFYNLHPTVAFPQPLTDEVLSDFGAQTYSTEPDIETLKADDKQKIEQWRDTQEKSGIVFTHNGRLWDGGLIVRQRLQPVVSLEALPSGFFWTDHNNNDVPMTLQELQDLNAAHEVALVTRGFEIHTLQRQMKLDINNMQVEQLLAFDPSLVGANR